MHLMVVTFLTFHTFIVMKKYLSILFFIIPVYLSAQTDTFAVAKPEAKEKTETPVFSLVEQPAEFPDGDVEFLKFIQRTIQYPQMERDNNIQGKVLLRFVILEDGSIENIVVARGVSPGLDKEAVRVVKLLPKFKPAKQRGKPVKVYFNLPVSFKLD